jgi:hypothetical protein
MKRTNAAETIIHAVWAGEAEGAIPVAEGSELLLSASAYATRCSSVGVGAGADLRVGRIGKRRRARRRSRFIE